MKKATRYAVRLAIGLILLLIIAWTLLWAYLSLNKKSLEARLEKAIHQKTNAEVDIGDLNISILHTFPFISLELSNVIVRDSLWSRHKHDLLNVEEIYTQINPLKIIQGKIPFNKVYIENGKFYQYTDSTGYSNINIFLKQDGSTKTGNDDYPDISGKNIEFIVEKRLQHKIFDLEIKQFNCSLSKLNDVLFVHADLNVLVHDMIFKPANGSFLHQTTISGNVKAQFNLSNKILSFDEIRLRINDHPFWVSGKFFTGLNPAPYEIAVGTKEIKYRSATSLLSENIQKALLLYEMDNTVDLEANLDGSKPELNAPVIHLSVAASHATVKTPVEIFRDCIFKADFYNRVDPSKPPGDANSSLRFKDFAGKTEEIPLQSDTVVFTDFIHPVLRCNLRSSFALKSLNNLFDSRSIELVGGNARLDIVFKGPIEAGDTISADIGGSISFDNASIRYRPKNFLLSDCSGNLEFQNKDVLIEHLVARVGSTQIKMDGGIKSLLALIDKNPAKLVLNWNIYSPKLNLHDFRSIIQRNSASPTPGSRQKFFAKQVYQIDSLLNNCDVNLHVTANELLYKKFDATNVKAMVVLKKNAIVLDSVMLNNSGGSLVFTGSVKEDGINNSLDLHAFINNVDIDKLFDAFENFGQDAITEKNIKGKFKADVDFSSQMSVQQEILPASMNGNIDFSLTNGELVNFEPVENISKKVFKDRSFTDIRFAELKDRFIIKGSSIKINRMEIESTAITLFVEGIYDTKKGSDMSIQVPLSNLKSRNEDSIPLNKGVKSSMGLNLRFRAKTGGDGKIKITWDPFNKSIKNMKKNEQTK